MKKLSLIALVLVSTAVFAAETKKATEIKKTAPTGSFERKYGTAGCGLGSMVIGKGDGINQIFATTTNGTFNNQLFGITFGTLNCDGGSIFNKAENMDRFVISNKVALANDISKGQGEAIATLANIMQCGDQNAQLGIALQKNFKAIFPSHKANTIEITDSIINTVAQDAVLADACQVRI